MTRNIVDVTVYYRTRTVNEIFLTCEEGNQTVTINICLYARQRRNAVGEILLETLICELRGKIPYKF